MVIFVDFNNMEDKGIVRLNCFGTRDDLLANNIVLEDGLRLTVSDGQELEADIIVRSPKAGGVWLGEIIGQIREI